eukprot:PhM_4_TR17450/c3_g1_i2/m.36602
MCFSAFMSSPSVRANTIPHCNNPLHRYTNSNIDTHDDADTQHIDSPDAELELAIYTDELILWCHAISNIYTHDDADTQHIDQPDTELAIYTDELILWCDAISNIYTHDDADTQHIDQPDAELELAIYTD